MALIPYAPSVGQNALQNLTGQIGDVELNSNHLKVPESHNTLALRRLEKKCFKPERHAETLVDTRQCVGAEGTLATPKYRKHK